MRKMINCFQLLICGLAILSCDKPIVPDDSEAPVVPEPVPELKYASKPLNQCETIAADWMHSYSYSSSNFSVQTFGADKKEGRFCYAIKYAFEGRGTSEYVYFRHGWDTWRTDLSFAPWGISFWIKGSPTNVGKLRFVLITDSKMTPGTQISREEYEYICDDWHKNSEWQLAFIPYSKLTPVAGTNVELQLDKVIAYRIDFVNADNVSQANNYVYIDDVRQQTTFDAEAEMNRNAKFNSIFIQLAPDYASKDASSWEESFRDLLSVGINEIIVQYAITDRGEAWYSDTQVSWASVREPIIDNIMAGAERCGFNVVLGMYGGGYGETNDALIPKNREVADDLIRRFGSSPSFSGWYIAQEFYDSTWERNWLKNSKERDALADYNEAVAAYCKSKKNVPVMIAPALWRGMPAKMTGEWFDAIFARTPNVDILYLQDCGGRGGLEVTCPTVDLPNWYKYIKEACDKHGVKFGVDLESFETLPSGGSISRDWDYLKYQLYIAGMFTDYITNFSWITFRPGDQNFETYRKTLTK